MTSFARRSIFASERPLPAHGASLLLNGALTSLGCPVLGASMPRFGPQDTPPAPETPEPESLTPEFDPDISKNPTAQRIASDLDTGKHPAEPHVTILPHKDADQTLRDLARFALISRLLFKNARNAEILKALDQAGHKMSEKTLQRLIRRSDFLDYYERFRNQLMAPLDKQIRDDFKLAMPEAFVKVIQLMRSAKSEKVQAEMAIEILEGGGGLQRNRTDKRFVFNVPPELQKAIFEAGKRFLPAELAPEPNDSEPS